jgi:hypothetical protein
MHSILDPTVGTFAGSIVELTDVLTMDIHIPTEDVLLPTEDIPPASDNILVRFTVGICRRTAEQRDEPRRKHRRSATPAVSDHVRRGGRGIGRGVQTQLQMRVGVRMPVIQLQRVAQIRFTSIDTNVSGSNPKRPLHEHVHPHT